MQSGVPMGKTARKAPVIIALAILVHGTLWCASENPDAPDVSGEQGAPRSLSYTEAPLPGTRPEHRQVNYWEQRWAKQFDLDETLLSHADIARTNTFLVNTGPVLALEALTRPPKRRALLREVNERLAYLRKRLAVGKLVADDGSPVPDDVLGRFERRRHLPPLAVSLRHAQGLVPVRCGPMRSGLRKPDSPLHYDRNNCSTVHPGEPVQVLARWNSRLLLVRTTYTLGWIPREAALSAPDDARSIGVEPPPLPLTRRVFLHAAFARLGTPYGWGGEEGGLDCSRLVMEVLRTFGLRLPRSSGAQSHAGTFTVDLTQVSDEERRLDLMDRASTSGLVLLHLPGHVMWYLGRDAQGTPMILHSLAELRLPSRTHPEDGPDRILPVGRVVVSRLDLGAGSQRGSLLQRLDRLTVFGSPPPPALQGAARLRPALPVVRPERCPEALSTAPDNDRPSEASPSVALLVTPHEPHPGQPLQAIVATWHAPGPADLALFVPQGRRVEGPVRRLGGPPYGWAVRIDHPQPGTWTVAFGDGDRVDACQRIQVRSTFEPPPHPEGVLTWEVTRRWNAKMEALYAVFVEALFDHPWRDAPTWTGLTPLIRDPKRNLLYGFFAPDEEQEIRLTPDCADLPYMLRAYFAWKLGLPHAFRECSRADDEHPVRCKNLRGHYAYTHDDSPALDFHHYAHQVKGRVHSSTVRTLPDDDDTDYYPVPLRRETLPPGTVFADRYGHTLVIVRWIPQTPIRDGVLLAADAQPDGTVGLRRFWRGSFLFHPEARLAGAGFKAARPVRYDPSRYAFSTLDNEALADAVLPFSRQQYERSVDSWYDRMAALVNPLPRDPERQLDTLVDALYETVQRRVASVALGEAYRAEHEEPIPMPHGRDIFLTSGPWEDYSTPSRDLRLLMAVDVVTGLISRVQHDPERYGVAPADRTATLRRLTDRLTRELHRRTIRYVRSDGSPWILTLDEIVSRQRAFEMAYNPNDCVERRWGAPAGSVEARTCRREAPEEQRERMAALRTWFARRERPAR